MVENRSPFVNIFIHHEAANHNHGVMDMELLRD